MDSSLVTTRKFVAASIALLFVVSPFCGVLLTMETLAKIQVVSFRPLLFVPVLVMLWGDDIRTEGHGD
jgi:hypothetical protein